MSQRIQPLTGNVRSPEQEALFATLTEGPRGRSIVLEDGSLFGPFNAMLLSPAVGDRLQALGLAVGGADALPPLVREAIILSVAGHRGSEGEWRVHLPRAIAAGLAEGDADGLRRGEVPTEAHDDLRSALELARLQLEHSPVPPVVYSRAVAALGERRVFEVAALVGYYDALCSIISLFELDQQGN